MAARTKRPGPHSGRGVARNLASGSPPPTVGVVGEDQPSGDPTPRPVWAQLHLFVVVYVVAAEPRPEPVPEPEPEDPGHQLPLPGFPDTPADHLAAARAALDRARREPRSRKRPA